MGWDTYLNIGLFREVYRKHTPSFPALMFDLQDYFVSETERDEDKSAFFRSTAKKCRLRLDELGYSWDFLINFYSEIRVVQGFSEGSFSSLLYRDVNYKNHEEHPMYKLFINFSAENDIIALTNYYRSLLFDDNFIYTNNVPGGPNNIGHLYEYLGKMFITDKNQLNDIIIVERYAALRAAESIGYIQNENPDLAWILFTRVLLSSIDDDANVEFDLQGYTSEAISLGITPNIENLGSIYIHSSIEELSKRAYTIGRMYSVLADAGNKLSRSYYRGKAQTILQVVNTKKGTAQERGKNLENLVEALIMMEKSLLVLQKNVVNEIEEIDLVLSNQLNNPFWISMQSPLIFVECKNWKTPVGASEARVFESKLRERGNLCRLGIFFAINGFTEPFTEVTKRIQSQGSIVFIVTGHDIKTMLEKDITLTDWIIHHGTIRIV